MGQREAQALIGGCVSKSLCAEIPTCILRGSRLARQTTALAWDAEKKPSSFLLPLPAREQGNMQIWPRESVILGLVRLCPFGTIGITAGPRSQHLHRSACIQVRELYF